MSAALQSAPRERPILFSAPMVRAIGEDRKTQTRRAVKLPPAPLHLGEWKVTRLGGDGSRLGSPDGPLAPYMGEGLWFTRAACKAHLSVSCPHGAIGDRLWVQEGYRIETAGTSDLQVRHLADDTAHLTDDLWDAESFDKWNRRRFPYRSSPGRFMYRCLSRIDLEITEVRVQRLQEISEEDARAEGVERVTSIGPLRAMGWRDYCGGAGFLHARESFFSLWASINGTASLAANPWVWALSFKQVRP